LSKSLDVSMTEYPVVDRIGWRRNESPLLILASWSAVASPRIIGIIESVSSTMDAAFQPNWPKTLDSMLPSERAIPDGDEVSASRSDISTTERKAETAEAVPKPELPFAFSVSAIKSAINKRSQPSFMYLIKGSLLRTE